ncbi:hypothetical protein [uncultured Dubosiella sp.]|uniref:hypothetical protein n=5 Tax=uncultured Dubosiella sp. TaxID=1937011 RepID=UPI002084A5EA|nr:hypothetical protein [uncultured Dubosiella sp.]GJM56397.1 hypothetical protein EROP_00900 [Erysipelotrichaceae bacterium OPF54]
MKALKKGIVLCLGLIMMAGCGSAPEQKTEKPVEKKLEKIELSVQKTEVDVDEALEITVSTTPKDIEIQTASFQKMDGAQIEKKEKKFVFKASKAGTYSVQVKQDAIDSNVLKIKAVDPKEKAEEEEEVAEDAAQSSQETAGQETGAQENPQVIVTGNGLPHNDPNWNAESSQETSENGSQNGPSTVDWVLGHVDQYLVPGQQTWVTGSVPQTLKQDANGNMSMVLWNNDKTQYIVLEGYSGAGNEEVTLTGTLRKDGNVYVLTVE